MSPLRRLWNIVRRDRLNDDLRHELETHLALIEEEERAHGSNIEEARQKARLRFGSLSVIVPCFHADSLAGGRRGRHRRLREKVGNRYPFHLVN